MDHSQSIFLAQTYVNLRMPQRALEILDDWAAPDDASTWLWRANALRELDRLEESLSCARIGLEHDAELPYLHQAIALAEMSLRRYAEAERAVVEAIRLHPEYAEAISLRALILSLTGRKEQAAEFSRQAMEIASHAEAVRLMDAFMTLQRGDSEAADELTHALLEEAPGSAPVHWMRGVSLASRARFPDAVRHHRVAAQLDPGNQLFVRFARMTNHWSTWPLRLPIPRAAVIAQVAFSLTLFVGFTFGVWKPFFYTIAFVLYLAVGFLVFVARPFR